MTPNEYRKKHKRCATCGQALDWSDENDYSRTVIYRLRSFSNLTCLQAL